EWSPASRQSTVTYSNINPGKYTFYVKSCNEDGKWNEESEYARFEFIIHPPWWQQWWVIASGVAVVASIIILLFRLRIGSIRKKAEAKQQQIALERDVLELEQRVLRLQMNPHFIFNAL